MNKSKNLSLTSSVITFAKTLEGHYSNSNQSMASPSNFAHINIYFRPLKSKSKHKIIFYSEQSYNHDPWRPYRQAIHKIYESNGIYIVENFSLEDPQRIAGGGENPSLLEGIGKQKLTQRKGCSMHFKELSEQEYLGRIEPGNSCIIKRNGLDTFLKSEVKLSKNRWISIDRGYDLKTNKQIWGSEHGPLVFNKVISIK